MRWKVWRALSRKHGPQWLMVMTFGAAILVGAVLLALPWSRASGRPGDALSSLFLATSATCVTGLSPIDIGRELTVFGQLTLLALVQLGGLGIMTFGSFLFEVIGRHLSKSDEQVLMSSLGVHSAGHVRSLLWRAVAFTAVWQVAGALTLGLRLFHAHGYSATQAAYHGIFHAVAAFCNAGFSLYPESLVRFARDPVILLTVALLVVAGGIGFIVHTNICAFAPWRRNRLARGHIALHTRIALAGTLALLVGGTLTIYLLERDSGFADLPSRDRWIGAFFQSVTCRTAGFNAIELESLRGLTKAISMLLMFIGGAPGSTAGGIKVTTAVVLAATVAAMIRNREDTEFGRRTVPVRAVREALVITVLGLMVVGLIASLLHLTEAANPALMPASGLSSRLVFEAVSAFGTVGLSLDVTGNLTAAGQVCIVVGMFVGRLGPLTIAMTMSGAAPGPARRYPEENVVVG